VDGIADIDDIISSILIHTSVVTISESKAELWDSFTNFATPTPVQFLTPRRKKRPVFEANFLSFLCAFAPLRELFLLKNNQV
jgi:hypothetical protein